MIAYGYRNDPLDREGAYFPAEVYLGENALQTMISHVFRQPAARVMIRNTVDDGARAMQQAKPPKTIGSWRKSL
jgi:hypothetical protein